MATKVAVVGAGSWGTAVAALAAPNAPAVLWARLPDLAESICRTRVNADYVPEVQLPDELTATASLEEAVTGADVVVMGVPSHGFRGVLGEAAPHLGPDTPI